MNISEFQCRPVGQWPGTLTRNRRRALFSAGYGDTVKLLNDELSHLEAKGVVLLMALSPEDIRLDGRPRSTAKPDHPGVVLSLTGKFGPVMIPCDTFYDWQDNLRAIALSLESLRALNRYGVATTGQQYRGWQALPAPDDASRWGVEQAKRFVESIVGNVTWREPYQSNAIKDALVKTHPDKPNGSPEKFKRVEQCRKIILGGNHA